jgi:hypothetical protein
MQLTGKTTNEIQQEIFDAIKNGEDINKLKEEISAAGFKPEGFYFTGETAHRIAMETPRSAAGGGVSGWQVFLTIVSVLVLVLRIARCSNRMH